MFSSSLQGKMLLVVGRKKAGKTTLIERLLAALRKKGYKVGSIKYTTGDHEFDTVGKDSYRHAQAGAGSTAIVSPHKAAIFLNVIANKELGEILNLVFGDYDLVLGEGFKSSPLPKIEVYNPDSDAPPLCSPEDNLIALVSKRKIDGDVPCFPPEPIDPLAEFIQQKLLEERRSQP